MTPDDLAGIPWEQMGVVSAIVVIVLVGIWAAKDVVLAMLAKPTPAPPAPAKRTPESASPRVTETWAMRVFTRAQRKALEEQEAADAAAAKAEAERSQEERIEALMRRVEELEQETEGIANE